ncbi:hypothetical protein FT663_02314 [Candidozyma haemuli var. vulneris]|uniref:Crh-like protein n=1 Tax=Candidozyma haemuli TaxID=45357 RepID=A0A2V1ASL6_9ASCO|nr:hypothetical protein CXQ85_004236 [[Candida] haemuloni]KAF3990035.1 hypothetical protein FT662_02486 [[Candida] haemuloni var. vulneris]KAF3992387.1 hypothetical protein FT663_02314 [[Candida] haemuloni var. vulneris]PVH20732.1 hypothetical protein CXQ85_004236 [[Candida] haemuloni]
MLFVVTLLAHFAAIIAATGTSNCNPLSSSCSPVPALGTDLVESFTEESDRFDVVAVPSGVSYTDDGLELTLKKKGDNPGIRSNFYIMFGRVEVLMKAAPGKGIVSSFFLMSDDLDEIDIELLGADDTQFQSNYFSKGNTETYDRGEYHSTPGSPQDNYFNYTIVWTENEVVWYLEGTPVRTLSSDNKQGFPQSPSYIKAGIWAGGDPSNEPGTIEWAGGSTDYSKAPFTMHIKKLIVDDYSSGDKYEYTDKSGSWKSIKAVNGEINGREGSQADESASSSSSPKSSSSSSSSSSAPSSSSSSSASSSAPSAVSSSPASSSSAAASTVAQSSQHTSPVATSASAGSGSGTTASTLATALTTGSGSGSGSGSQSDSGSANESGSGSGSGSDSGSSASASSSAIPTVSSNDLATATGLSGFLVLVALALNF